MNEFIKAELEKVTEVKLNFNDFTTSIFIPRKREIKLEVNGNYIIKLDQRLLNRNINTNLVSNWNAGSVPNSLFYKATITNMVNDMIKITGVAFDFVTKNDLDFMWSGWLPRSQIEILEVL